MEYRLAAIGAEFGTLDQAVGQARQSVKSGCLLTTRHRVAATIGDEEQTWDVVAYAAVIAGDGVNALLFRDADAIDGDRNSAYVRYVLVRVSAGDIGRISGVYICPPQLDSPEQALLGVLSAAK